MPQKEKVIMKTTQGLKEELIGKKSFTKQYIMVDILPIM